MISIMYTLTYGISLVLITTLTLLIIPIPKVVKKQILKLTKAVVKTKIISITVLVLVTLLYAESFYRMKRYEAIKDEMPVDTQINTRIANYTELFRSQRNAYINFFNLLLVIILWRVGSLVNKLIN
ncbi:hypothetical protein EIN_485480 [Entamoeba invadens IP1]|uniref:BAP29/BAP31 transmembrane domain-containing protein n=1 Tax=Entamoeba invadens IP1 TaxID=370355 RepID=A0A0A1U4H6_ENTIV|nr:hypothetical protein EIN_485480 [Entamoeba invadens IP1]ELP89156.1 hypothetical protein EIN_485480 [Entamoeba invadens IP1]|eukprot:XP_004255927.1 hypothetical protein EIN_485480 [Entamoeba invadens IP1]